MPLLHLSKKSTFLAAVFMLCALLPVRGVAQSGSETPCGTLAPTAASTTDCMIDVDGFVLNFDYADDTNPTRVTVTQTDRYGEQLSEVERHDIRDALFPPTARDITGDGRADVMLPLFADGDNTTFKIYQPDAEGTFFASGEITAASPEAVRGVDGLTIAVTQEGPDVARETAFAPDNWHGFDIVYVLEIDSDQKNCTLVEENDLASRGFSAEGIVADCMARSW